VSCSDYCNGHTGFCFAKDTPNLTTNATSGADEKRRYVVDATDLGSILQSSISAENFSDKFSPSNFGRIGTRKTTNCLTYLRIMDNLGF
jgi:hypothetical protein